MKGEAEGEEGEGARGRWADMHSLQGVPGGADHLPLEVAQGRREGELQWHRVRSDIQGGARANHRPEEEEVEEEEGNLSRRERGRG